MRAVVIGMASALLAACGRVVTHEECITPPPEIAGDGGPRSGPSGSSVPDAGDPPAPSASLATSGARLRAVYLEAADGAREFVGWHDLERGEDCTFGTGYGHPDYQERCLPARYPFMRTGDAHFTDAACTKEIFAHHPALACPPGAAGMRYVVVADGVHALGARVYPAAPHHFDIDGKCVPEMDPSVEYFANGPVVPPSAFVAAQVQVEAPSPGARFTHVTRIATDGARERLQVFDTVLGATCGPYNAADGLLRCAPAPVGVVADNRHTGPDCAHIVADCTWSAHCQPPPWNVKSFVMAVEGGAAPRARFFEVGPYPTDADPYFFARTTDGQCIALGDRWASHSVGIVGAEVPAEGMALVADEIAQTATRLQRRAYAIHPAGTDPGVPTLVGRNVGRTYPWRDSALGDDCKFERTADGEIRCVSSNATLFAIYADDACAEPKVRTNANQKFFRIESGACGASLRRITNRVSVLGAYFTYQDDGSGHPTCLPRDAGSTSISVYDVGEDVTSTLVRAERVVD